MDQEAFRKMIERELSGLIGKPNPGVAQVREYLMRRLEELYPAPRYEARPLPIDPAEPTVLRFEVRRVHVPPLQFVTSDIRLTFD